MGAPAPATESAVGTVYLAQSTLQWCRTKEHQRELEGCTKPAVNCKYKNISHLVDVGQIKQQAQTDVYYPPIGTRGSRMSIYLRKVALLCAFLFLEEEYWSQGQSLP